MSQLSSISSHEEDFDSGLSDRAPSSASTSSHSQCSSSTSIFTIAAAEPVQDREVSVSSTLGTAWTDSKHSSYLNFMEANFVQSMFGSRHWSEDVHGMMSHDYQQCSSNEELDEDSAQSQLRENMEFKKFDHGEQTWKSCPRPMIPPGIPLVLLANNPWVKHFRPKKPSTTVPSMQLPPRNDTATSSTMNEIGRKEHLPRLSTLNNASASNFGNEYGRLSAGESKQWMRKSMPDQTFHASALSGKRQALWSTYSSVLATRRKINEDASCGQIGANIQDGTSSPSLAENLANL